jgi:pyruvate-formate lyase-activating enzyme
MSKFCSRPFHHLYTDPTGEYRLCCKSKPSGESIHSLTPLEWFNSDKINNIRNIFINGDPTTNPETKELCNNCWKLEEQGMQSFRESTQLPSMSNYAFPYKLAINSLNLQISIFGNYCNLSCIMCWPTSSSRRTIDLNKIESISKYKYNNQNTKALNVDYGSTYNTTTVERFIKYDLPELMPFLSNINFVGGEPMMLYDHYRVLDVLVYSGYSHNIKLGYTSNITIFKCRDKDFFNYIDKFKVVIIKASIDAHGEYYEYIRQHSKWDLVVNNIKRLNATPGVDLRVVGLISSLTALHITESYFELIELGIAPDNIDLYTNILIKPTFLSAKHLPQNIKDTLLDSIPDIKVFNSIRQILKQKGNIKDTQMLIEYLQDIDKLYGTSYKETWPELDIKSLAVTQL